MNSSDHKLLVTGATGFIGSRLAMHAHCIGIDVLATGRAACPAEFQRLEELHAVGIPTLVGDLTETAFVNSMLKGRNAVIHLAAAQHESHMPDDYFRSMNVVATQRVLDAARQAGVRRFVYGSTVGVYGDAPAGPLDEASPTRPDNIYGVTKLEAESLVHNHIHELDTCVVRISETYGPGDLRLLKLFQAVERGHFMMIGTGSNRRQLIHVTDLVRGLLIAAQHPAAIGQTFVFAGREVMTTSETVAQIAMALQREPPTMNLPLWPFAVTATVLETVLRPLRIQPPLHPRRLDFFRKSLTFSTAKATALLGFRAEINFRAGAIETARWYRSRHQLPQTLTNEIVGPHSA